MHGYIDYDTTGRYKHIEIYIIYKIYRYYQFIQIVTGVKI